MNNIKRRILSRGLMFFASLGTLTSCAVSDIVAKRGMSEKEMQLISNTPKITVTTEQLEVVSDIGQDYFIDLLHTLNIYLKQYIFLLLKEKE